ncbi:MAG: formylglycine-generating enzyme family protein [Chromatiaceae bacterium]|nr:formylglycine-generating enzyme family protein [Chromatiaceae bacterium]
MGSDSAGEQSNAQDLAFWEELAFWEAVENSENPAELEAYLHAYPKGRFAPLAKVRINALKKQGSNETEQAPQIAPPESGSAAGIGEEQPVDVEEAPASAKAQAGNQFRDCAECPLMAVIPAGRFTMGSKHHRNEEKPVHEVTIPEPFAIGVYEVTVGEWDACLREAGCDHTPTSLDNAQMPVADVSWDDAQQYVVWLSKKTGKDYRLPSEAEWEYAARGGSDTAFWWGDAVGTNNADCRDCGSEWDGKSAAPIGSFKPNPFGLYDVHGNLWEWTQDCSNRSYKGAPSDGSPWLRGDCLARMLRGGSWNLEADYMRSTRRHSYDWDVRYYLHGFRVARPYP